MSEVHESLLEDLLKADEFVRDEEARTQLWQEERNQFVRIAVLNGVTVDAIASHLGRPIETVQSWLDGASPR